METQLLYHEYSRGYLLIFSSLKLRKNHTNTHTADAPNKKVVLQQNVRIWRILILRHRAVSTPRGRHWTRVWLVWRVVRIPNNPSPVFFLLYVRILDHVRDTAQYKRLGPFNRAINPAGFARASLRVALRLNCLAEPICTRRATIIANPPPRRRAAGPLMQANYTIYYMRAAYSKPADPHMCVCV